jgi:glucan-binding YG repeat protein
VDGIFGNGTDSALRDFQSKNGLVVDGVCGNATWDKLTYVAPVVQPKLNGFVKNEKSEWNYYVNGEMQKSRWLLDVGKYYWVNENGVMQTGWIKVDSKWYFLAKDGSMQVGWIEDNGKKYFFSADGSMKVGWMKEDDDSFYFANDGSLISGGWNCIEGKWFCFDADGELIEGTKLAANITVNADGSISKIENN